MDDVTLQRAATAAMGRYADALDGRDWALLDRVFAPDVQSLYGTVPGVDGRDKLVPFIRAHLDPCGPTQHLMGVTRVSGPMATKTQIRAFHIDHDGQRTYEAVGTYWVEWRTDGDEVLAARWRFDVIAHVGDPSILGRP